MFGAILAVISTYLEARFTNVRSCFVGSFPCQLFSLAVLPGFSRPSCCMYFGYTHHAAGLCINGWPGVFPTQITLAETHVVAIYTQSDIPYSASGVLALNARSQTIE
jgi:hypothetical protein